MLSRRQALKRAIHISAAAALPFPEFGGAFANADSSVIEVNDMQSRLNATRVHRVVEPTTHDQIVSILQSARREGHAVSIAGGRHSMGGQQFGRDTVLIDMRSMNRVVQFDAERGIVEVEGGIQWTELVTHLLQAQEGQTQPWTIRQKQTGVDRVTLGGALASNVHGRGLRFAPIVQDVESFVMIDAAGKTHQCSRRENSELFSLAIGGYGLFGVITRVSLRLMPRMKMRRLVEIIAIKDLHSKFRERLNDNCIYGDCQYSTDLETEAGAHAGVLSCYQPIPIDHPIRDGQRHLSSDDWAELYTLARTNKKKAFEQYSSHYLATSGQVYWSDSLQMASAFQDYSRAVDPGKGSEMITEVYVSPDNFMELVSVARQDFIDHQVDMTYGTIRLIDVDAETFLPWARKPSVCIVCNLHVEHTDAGIAKATTDFRRIIDRAIEHGGSYFLTYHRWATRAQVETCYPEMIDFLRLKRKYDPDEVFQSEWYRHMKQMFADRL